MAQWIARQTSNLEVAGSSPAWGVDTLPFWLVDPAESVEDIDTPESKVEKRKLVYTFSDINPN